MTARVLVTGAASGLGAALATAFEARGDQVLRTDRHPGADLRLDITQPDDWAAAVAHVIDTWGGLDVLVNNAGIAGGGRLDVCTLEEWRQLVEVNLFGVVQGIRAFVPMMKAQKSGQIVNVASLAGLVHPAGMASYNATKAAVVALSETAAHELAGHGVRCAVVCPSYFRTNLINDLAVSDATLGGVVKHLVEASPLTAEDIAAAVLAGLERGDELIIPDEPAWTAYHLKQSDRAAYDAQMRRQAAKLDQLG